MPTSLDAFGAQIRPSRKRVVNRGCGIEDNSLFRTEQSCSDDRTRVGDAISAVFYILYAPCERPLLARGGSGDTDRQGPFFRPLGGSGRHGEVWLWGMNRRSF